MNFLSGRSLALIVSVLLFSLIYFVFNTVGPKKSPEPSATSTTVKVPALDTRAAEEKALAALSADSATLVKGLTDQASKGEISSLKTLSGLYYRKGIFLLAGHYAAEVARQEQTAAAWNIAGSSYLAGLSAGSDEQLRQSMADQAVAAFDEAVKLDEANIDYKVNRASVFAEVPPKENPMMGVMELLELNKQHPDNVTVLLVLAKLGLRTHQYEKVVERLNKVLSLQPDNRDAVCMLAVAYDGLGDHARTDEMSARCAQLSK